MRSQRITLTRCASAAHRPRVRVAPERVQAVARLTVAEASADLSVSSAALKRYAVAQSPLRLASRVPADSEGCAARRTPDQEQLIVSRAAVREGQRRSATAGEEVSLKDALHAIIFTSGRPRGYS